MLPGIRQINISYDVEEDRLLLKASTSADEEYLLWMTRRFTGLLYRTLTQQAGENRLMNEPDTASEISRSIKQGALEKPWQASKNSTRFPLGEDGVLGHRIGLNREGDVMTLQLLPKAGQGMHFRLNASMLYMFRNLLEQGIRATDWQLLDEQIPPADLH